MTSTLADLQRRNIEQMAGDAPSTEPIPVNTEIRKPLLTEVREEASAEVSKSLREDARPSVRKSARKQVSEDAEAEPDYAYELIGHVEAALASREPLIGGVKATVDMSPELSSRAKRYLADHRGQSTRQVLIALFDAFLSAKGY